ncbi:MAG: hypothetical protein DWQ37_10255 [Planctomycetota bacterium]|nr:MAG: hypothetical protein DWQ37_10255 [Planctomycetota bacterium]
MPGRRAWIAAAVADDERERRQRSDFLTYETAVGAIADFNPTRHTIITAIVAGGASVKVAQELARHSTCRLTIDRYAKTQLHDLRGALDGLPAFGGNEAEAGELRATGTDGINALEQNGAQHLAQQLGGESVLFGATSCLNETLASANENPPASPQAEPSREVMRDGAAGNDERRRWESNPRWRICNARETCEWFLNSSEVP